MRIKGLLLALSLFVCVAVVSAPRGDTGCRRGPTAARRTTRPPCSSVWRGTSPSKTVDFVIVASNSGEIDAPTNDVRVTVFARRHGSPWNQLVRTADWQNPKALYSFELLVYPDSDKDTLLCGVCIGGGDATGVSVLSVDNRGKVRVLFNDVNWGNPRLRIANGKPEVEEIWPIHRLRQAHCWTPPPEFSGHVLAKRTWRPDKSGVYKLRRTSIAREEERKLPAQEFRDLVKAQQLRE